MKKNIVSLLFIGFIAMISLSFQSSSSRGNNSGSGKISLHWIEGQDDDGIWKVVDFKLVGFNPETDQIDYIEIQDQFNMKVGIVEFPDGRFVGKRNGSGDGHDGEDDERRSIQNSNLKYVVSLELERYNLPSRLSESNHERNHQRVPFNLIIHILSDNGGSGVVGALSKAGVSSLAMSPLVPDETTITVKYP